MRRVWTCLTSVGSCFVLVAIWGMLSFAGSALADPPPHNHGGDDETARACVTLADYIDVAKTIAAKFTGDHREPEYCSDETGVVVRVDEGFHFKADPKKSNRHVEIELSNPDCIGTGENPCSVISAGAGTSNLPEYKQVAPGVFEAQSGSLDFLAMVEGVKHERFTGLRTGFASDSKSTINLVVFGSASGFDCLAEQRGGTPVSVIRMPGDIWILSAIPPFDQACLLETGKGNQREYVATIDMPLKITVFAPQ